MLCAFGFYRYLFEHHGTNQETKNNNVLLQFFYSNKNLDDASFLVIPPKVQPMPSFEANSNGSKF
jgi:hypothetical protein